MQLPPTGLQERLQKRGGACDWLRDVITSMTPGDGRYSINSPTYLVHQPPLSHHGILRLRYRPRSRPRRQLHRPVIGQPAKAVVELAHRDRRVLAANGTEQLGQRTLTGRAPCLAMIEILERINAPWNQRLK